MPATLSNFYEGNGCSTDNQHVCKERLDSKQVFWIGELRCFVSRLSRRSSVIMLFLHSQTTGISSEYFGPSRLQVASAVTHQLQQLAEIRSLCGLSGGYRQSSVTVGGPAVIARHRCTRWCERGADDYPPPRRAVSPPYTSFVSSRSHKYPYGSCAGLLLTLTRRAPRAHTPSAFWLKTVQRIFHFDAPLRVCWVQAPARHAHVP